MDNQEFFILTTAVDTIETGVFYPQVEMIAGYDFKTIDSVHKIGYREFPDFQPNLSFKLKRGAKLTDLLSHGAISSHGFLASSKFIEFLKKRNLPKFRVYPASVKLDNQILTHYSWIQFILKYPIEINWKESLFYIKRLTKIVGGIDLNSYQDYLEKANDLNLFKSIRYASLKFAEPLVLDIFTLPFSSRIFASKKLYNLIIESNFEGIACIPQHDTSL